jgi:chaperonin GroES
MFKPLNDRVLVKPDEKEEMTTFGLIIPDSANAEVPFTGTVVVGGKLVKKGDHVLFSKFGFDELKIKGTPHYVISESNLLGIL